MIYNTSINGDVGAIERRIADTPDVIVIALLINGERVVANDSISTNAGTVADNQMRVTMEFNIMANLGIAVHHIPSAMIMDIAIAVVAYNLQSDRTDLLNAILIEIMHVGLSEKCSDSYISIIQ